MSPYSYAFVSQRYERTDQIPMSQLSKVPGCTSITQVGVIVYKDKVRVFGVSDAAVSRGIMWLVCNVLSGNSVEEVLNCDASEFTSRIGLDVGLSEGRGNGIGNIVRTVQKLLRGEGPRSTTTNTGTSERPRTAVLLSGGGKRVKSHKNIIPRNQIQSNPLLTPHTQPS